jgi:acetyl esterase
MPAAQLLIYPVTDLTMSSPSVGRYGSAYGLSSEDVAWFYRHYLAGGGDRHDPYVSPGLAGDLSVLPAAHVVTVGFDPLLDEGLAYVAALRAAGVPTTHRHHPGLIHGAFELAAVVPAGRTLLTDAARTLAAMVGQLAPRARGSSCGPGPAERGPGAAG